MNHLSKFGKSYETGEEFEFRFEQFKKADAIIKEINSRPGNTYTVAHNAFSTWTKEEQKKIMGLQKSSTLQNSPVVQLDESDLPGEVDWRSKGAINAIQN